MRLIAILTFATLNASAQVTLTPIQVRTVHAIMDNEQRLREQAAIDSADLADYATALRQSETLRLKAEADAKDLSQLRDIESERGDRLQDALTREARKKRARSVMLLVATGVAVVEGVVIAVALR